MKTCTWIFIEVLFIIAKNIPNVSWIYPKCPPLAQWVNELWCLCTMGYFSAVALSLLPNPMKTQIRLKCIMPSERSQVHKATYHRNRLIWHLGKIQIGIKSKSMISRGWGMVDNKRAWKNLRDNGTLLWLCWLYNWMCLPDGEILHYVNYTLIKKWINYMNCIWN